MTELWGPTERLQGHGSVTELPADGAASPTSAGLAEPRFPCAGSPFQPEEMDLRGHGARVEAEAWSPRFWWPAVSPGSGGGHLSPWEAFSVAVTQPWGCTARGMQRRRAPSSGPLASPLCPSWHVPGSVCRREASSAYSGLAPPCSPRSVIAAFPFVKAGTQSPCSALGQGPA